MDIDAALRTGGHRVTRPRRLVWEVLTASEQAHLSAQQIVDRVNDLDPTVNRSSIYRVLGLLAELGLVRESRLAGAERSTATWEITHGDGVIHLVCSGCGGIEHHHTELIDELISTGKLKLDGEKAGSVTFHDPCYPVSYTHLTLPTTSALCRSRWSPYQ